MPAALRVAGGLSIWPTAGPSPTCSPTSGELAGASGPADRLVCFAGAGAYDHEIPPVVRALAGRSEFVTSYTPYQPEVAQGVLQAVFEFQTMVARLAGLPVANASLYDGASALVEAVNLGVAAARRQTVWVSAGVHPHWRAVLATFAAGTGHRLVECRSSPGGRPGRTAAGRAVGPDGARPPGVVVVGYPNYLGCLEDLAAARRLCDEHGAVLVVAADPVAAGILRSPGEWGADVVVGEGQAFGTRSASAAPTSGCSPARSTRSAACPGGWSARPSTSTAGGPT